MRCWPGGRQRSCADADLRICRYCSKECQVLHWKSGHKIGCKRKGVDFALFNIPHR
jgi:hypothetical protein